MMTQAIMDTILKIGAVGGVISAALVAPNIVQALDKPLTNYLKKLDKRARQREVARTITYMKSRGLIRGDYEHGLQITKKGRDRLKKSEYQKLSVPSQDEWDGAWRLVFYDIPEKHKVGRDALTQKLRSLNFYQLQRSIWVHPFPCRDEVAKVTDRNDVARFTSIVETYFIDRQDKLIERFKRAYPKTHFSLHNKSSDSSKK